MSAPLRKSETATADDPVAPVCALLAELLSREIDEPLLSLLRLPEVRSVIETVAPETGALPGAKWDAARFEEHSVEFCRLFIYPGICAPRAEHWAKDFEEEQFSVRRWFDNEGAQPAFTPRIEELPDTHIAKILVVRAGLAGASEELVADFEAQMIRPWAASFASALEQQSQLPIYTAAAAIVGALAETQPC